MVYVQRTSQIGLAKKIFGFATISIWACLLTAKTFHNFNIVDFGWLYG